MPAGHVNLATFRYCIGHGLLVFGVVLMFSMLLVGQNLASSQSSQSRDDRLQKLDSRWLPWIGSWRLISNTVNTADGEVSGKSTLEIKPGEDRRSVVMKGSQDDEVLYDEKKVVVDGSRHPIEDEECDGWYKYNWSDTGKRLLFESEVICSDNRLRNISGISLFTDPDEWADIQLLISGKDRMITIRRYRETDDIQNIPGARGARHFARVAAGTNFSIEEIIELTDKVAPEALEAALVEMRKPFEINSKVLLHLSDAGVPSQVVDLMVALSFPDKFTIEPHAAESAVRPEPRQPETVAVYPYAWSPFGIWSYYDPFFPWYWSSPAYLYGYWGWGGYYPTYWSSPGYGGYRIRGGRLVAGQGYSRIYPSGPNSPPRYAQPRSSSGRSGSGSAPARASSSRSGSGISGGSSGGSGGGSPSASPGGYSGGGGGRQARRR